MRKTLWIFGLITVSLGLGGCTTTKPGAPNQMARGYIAYNDHFKSAHGAEARPIGYPFSVEKNNSVIADMRFAASDLVEKLDRTVSFSDDKLYLTPSPNSSFYNSFDHLLRDELLKRGYTISASPANAIPVTFVAQETNAAAPAVASTHMQDAKSAYRNLLLTLNVGGPVIKGVSHVEGIYEVPTYDFTASEPEKKECAKPKPAKTDDMRTRGLKTSGTVQ